MQNKMLMGVRVRGRAGGTFKLSPLADQPELDGDSESDTARILRLVAAAAATRKDSDRDSGASGSNSEPLASASETIPGQRPPDSEPD